MIAVTGASGQLGRLVVSELVKHTPASSVVALARHPAEAQGAIAPGVQLRQADYDRPSTLENAFAGVDKVLLISAPVPGNLVRQHEAVIDAARKAGVRFLAYTSMLRADTSTMHIAAEHRRTEAAIRDSGLRYALLRNGWYLENHMAAIPLALLHGALIGSSGDGRFASAARADYAAAAAGVLTTGAFENATLELAGDHSFDMAELAAEISRQTGTLVPYQNMTSERYRFILLGLGLPRTLIEVALDADSKADRGELDSDSRQLGSLLGRPTTTLAEAVRAALQGQAPGISKAHFPLRHFSHSTPHRDETREHSLRSGA